MIVIEHHRSGYPHSHGLLASTKTLEELKDAYPIENVHAIKLKPITNIDGWIEYCNKTLQSESNKKELKEIKKVIQGGCIYYRVVKTLWYCVCNGVDREWLRIIVVECLESH